LAGIIASLATIAVVWVLGQALFSTRPGNWAVLLLLFHPPFWFGAITNQVRVFLALGSAALMIAAWRSMQHEPPRYFYVTGAVLGITAGFRPELLAFGAPIIIYCGWRKQRPLRQWAITALITATIVSAWLAVVVSEAGGVLPYVQLMKEYSETQFGPTSLVFGADTSAAARMFRMAIAWYGLPVLAWLWLAPFAKNAGSRLDGAFGFLAVSVVPGFLFHAFIHVGDPDHTLVGVPAIVIVGGVVLAAIKRVEMAGVAVALNLLLFFAPPRGVAQAFSYTAVRGIEEAARETISAIEELRRSRDVVLVTYDHKLTWRHFFYYFRDAPLVVLHDDPRSTLENPSAWLIRAAPSRSTDALTSEIVLPPCERIVWLLSHGRGMHRLLERNIELKRATSIAYSDTKPGTEFRFGTYLFKTHFSRLPSPPTPLREPAPPTTRAEEPAARGSAPTARL
jgi:hypothetical protein